MAKIRSVSIALAILLALTLVCPALAQEEEPPEVQGSIKYNSTDIDVNTQHIEFNYAHINTNRATVDCNTGAGVIALNDTDGSVGRNNTQIDANSGKVGYNPGTVTVNNADGAVDLNEGTIITNNGSVKDASSAGIIRDNYGTVEKTSGEIDRSSYTNAAVENNYGTVVLNDSYIYENSGTVNTNNGVITAVALYGEAMVGNNKKDGVIGIVFSDGSVTTNNGTVESNLGTVKGNSQTGTVRENEGTVIINLGTVAVNTGEVRQNAGTVDKNYGTVSDKPGGTVTENFGTWINEDNVTHLGVSYHAEAGSRGLPKDGSAHTSYQAVPGQRITIADCAFTKDGYVFISWKGTDSGSYLPGTVLTVNDPLCLIAQWQKMVGGNPSGTTYTVRLISSADDEDLVYEVGAPFAGFTGVKAGRVDHRTFLPEEAYEARGSENGNTIVSIHPSFLRDFAGTVYITFAFDGGNGFTSVNG